MKNLEDFKDIHKGERCFIACNGPSLNDIDVSKLQNEIVFGLNRGYLKKDLPIKYMVVTATPIMRQFGDEILSVKCDAIFCDRLSGDNVCNVRFGGVGRIFQTDITKNLFRGRTVTFAALQLSYMMGFAEVYIIGMDHNFTYTNTKKYGDYKNLVISTDKDLNHFDPTYFSKGTYWGKYAPTNVEFNYKLAVDAFRKDDRKVYNASTFTKLSEDIMPRINFNDLF